MDLTCDEEMLSDSESGTPLAPNQDNDNDETLQQMHFFDEMPPAYVDPTLVKDPRVLKNLLKLEERLMPSVVSFKLIQTEITPDMRQSVATWMYEVCEEERCPEGVFLRAISYMDRFLSVHKIERNQFQLLGAACMLISSKWIGSVLSTDRLIFYTANSITLEMLLEWELMILTVNKWDMFTIIPTDFMEHLLYRLPQNLWNAPHVREAAKTYTAFCATDHNFCIHPPSMIAASTIAATVGHHVSPGVLNDVLHQLHEITRIETDVLRSCMEKVKANIPVTKENLKVPGLGSGPGSSQMMMGADKLEELEQAETPTDVGDIHF